VIVLAILCLVLAAAVVAAMILVGFTSTVTFTTSVGDIHTRPVWVFLLGAVTLFIALVGLSLLQRGTRRKVQRRREIKRLRQLEKEAPATRSAPSSGPAGPAAGGGTATRTPDDAPDRTLVREQPIDVRTPPGSAVRTGEDPQTGPARRSH
jgi:hypothetical protein